MISQSFSKLITEEEGYLLETFADPKALIDNPQFREQRILSLAGLNIVDIDSPIVDIINGIAHLEHCFSLQCCYGHFLYDGQHEPL